MFVEFEDAVPKRPRGIEGRISVFEAAIPKGNTRFGLRDDFSIKPNDPILGPLHTFPLTECF